MPKGMQPGVLGFAVFRDHASSDLRRDQAASNDVLKTHDVPLVTREHKIMRALWAGEFPFPQGIQDLRSKRNGSFSRFGLWLADCVVAIRTLANVQLAALEVYILPSKAPRLTGA